MILYRSFVRCVCGWLAGFLSVVPVCVRAATYHVSAGGHDGATGTETAPFATIQRAADVMVAGDRCLVHEGTYRETVAPKNSGAPGKPIRFEASGGLVTVSGTRKIEGTWKPWKGRIQRIACAEPVGQLFYNGRMMVEARWPNMPMSRLWRRECWAAAGQGSRYGRIVDPKLRETGIDWTGGIAVLNVAHQFFTWTRPVQRCEDGALEYAQDLEGITSYGSRTKPWEDDRYYLFGKLEALDAPGEWFRDDAGKQLYFWCADGAPGEGTVEAKTRDYGFHVENRTAIEVRGFRFFGCTVLFEGCEDCIVERCRLEYPVFAARFNEGREPVAHVTTGMSGARCTVRDCVIAFASTTGLKMQGTRHRLENNLVHDVCWSGSLHFPAIDAANTGGPEDGILVRSNTVYNSGNVLIRASGPGNILEYNHVYDGGLACKDVALMYTGMPECAGTVIRYNWVHGCRTEEGLGLGIRGDDQTRSLTVHHNVVWDCGRDGIIVKGDFNLVCNNTVFGIGGRSRTGNFINLHVEPEPEKWWRKQAPLLPAQNQHSRVVNNAAATIVGGNAGEPCRGVSLSHNYARPDLPLMDPRAFDFRPKAGSPLVDAGEAIPGITDGFSGAAPDIGAYEQGRDSWRAGSDRRNEE